MSGKRALAWAFVAAGLLAAPAHAQTQAGDMETLSAQLGGDPLHCAETAEDRRLCTWHPRRLHHVVCELNAAFWRTEKPCLSLADNETMKTFGSSGRKKPGTQDRRIRKRMREEARAQLDGAGSLDGVVALIGAGPVWCRRAEGLRCGWHVVRRTPGYIAIARAANAPGRKVAVVCRFSADGSSAPGACSAEPSGKPPIP